MKKQCSILLCVILLLLTAFCLTRIPAHAEEIVSGTCGENLTWTFDSETGTLTISGTGSMDNYTYSGDAPWFKGNEPVYQSITTVVMEDGVASVGEFAFNGCKNLTRVELGRDVKTIGLAAFEMCGNLKQVSLPEGLEIIGSYAFDYCESLTTISIPNTVAEIGEYAFQCCSQLTEITLGSGLTSVSDTLFYGCENLSKIWVDAGSASFASDSSGVLFNKDMTTLVMAPLAISGEYTVPDGVTTIGQFAFSNSVSF